MNAQQLKNSILQMAVQGKLVPQDPNDEPASILLERILKEKEKLIKEGRIKKEKTPSYIFRGDGNLPYEKVGKNEPVCIADEVPFEIPESWEWIRHNMLFEVQGGSQPPKSKFISTPKDGYVRLYQIRDYGNNPVPVYIPEKSAKKTTKKGDILLARYGASLGKVFFAEDGAYNVAMAKVIPLFSSQLINKKYLYLFYHSKLYQDIVIGNSRSAQAGFNKDDLHNLWFPVPPLSEQQRIVETYMVLESYLNRLEKTELDTKQLNVLFPEMLRKSILQQAVMGKLVSQDPKEGSAEDILDTLSHKKEHIKPCKEDLIYSSMDFDIPETWRMVELNQIFDFVDYRGKTPNKTTEGVFLITASNIKTGYMDYTRKEYITQDEYSERQGRGITERGDLLFTTEAPMGNAAICDLDECSCGQRIITFKEYTNNTIYPRLFMYFILSPQFYQQLLDNCTGTTAKGIKAEKLKHLRIPLPPFDEQKRITAKIESLLKCCECFA